MSQSAHARSCFRVCVQIVLRVAILSILSTATGWGQLTTPVPSPSRAFVVLNVGEGSDRHFEIQESEAGYRTILSAAKLRFPREPFSKAAVDAVWSPDDSSVAIEIALNKSTAITCVYSRQGETFLPLPLDASQANHKIVPLGWHGSHDLIVSIDGPYPTTDGDSAFGRHCTFRFRPNKPRFEKVYESAPSRLKPAKLLLCLDRADDPEIQKLREKYRWERDYFRKRNFAALLSGPAAEDAMANLLSSPRLSDKSLSLGIYGLGLLLYLDEHDRARCLIDMTDAPKAWILPAKSNAVFIWSLFDHSIPPRPGDEYPEFERYIARDFYHKLLPELRRVKPEEMEHTEDFVRQVFKHSLKDHISKMFDRD